jgi:aminomethyltransferase
LPFQISPTHRVRRSPFYESTVADGVVSFSPYNHMLMPTGYGDPLGEYWRLINGVAMWDVAVERQVEISGPDAARLVQILTPRKLERLEPGCGWYVAICDHRGVLINDPILLKHAEDRYWLSIADGDLLLWCRAVAAERRLDVTIAEPDVSPLAIQGPKAEDVVAALLGQDVRSIGYFRFRRAELDGIPLVVARSGWSKQGGFELYLMDGSKGNELWRKVKEAGRPFDIGPGSPNAMERLESGLLNWGGDTDDETNPFEVRLGRYVDLDVPDDVVGIGALREINRRGPSRHQLGVFIDGAQRHGPTDQFGRVRRGERDLGRVTAHTWSPRLERNIGLCLVSRTVRPGQAVEIVLPDGTQVDGELTELPFL